MTAPARRPWAAGTCTLTSDHRLLLRAALADGPEALAAWRELRPHFDVDAADGDVHRLLPLLGWNLARAGLDPATEAELPRLLGLVRRTWAQNQRRFHALAQVLPDLAAHGIRPILVKGAALATSTYPTPGLRPMEDVDLLVEPPDRDRTLALLEARGFTIADRTVRDPANELGAIGPGELDRLEIDLHWRLNQHLALPNGHAADRELWARAVDVHLAEGVAARRLSGADEMLVTLVHGMISPGTAPLRWIADATWLADTTAIDWPVLVDQARRRRCALAVRRALELLDREGFVSVPAPTLTALRRQQPGPRERFQLFAARSSMVPTFVGALLYLRQTEPPGSTRRSLAERTMYLLDVDSIPEAARALVGKSRAYVGRRLP
jgi:hypothetical protein